MAKNVSMDEITRGILNRFSVDITKDLRYGMTFENLVSGKKQLHISLEDGEGTFVQELATFITEDDAKLEKVDTVIFLDGRDDSACLEYPIGIVDDSDISDVDESVSRVLSKENDISGEATDDEVGEGDDICEDTEDVECAEETEGTEDSLMLFYGCQGDEVKRLQYRLKELGYFAGNIGGHYYDLTQAAVEAFELDAGLQVDGLCDQLTWERIFADDAPKAAKGGLATDQNYAKTMDWWKSDIQKIFSKGTDALITDVETRLSWMERRRGGTNHADVQPLTKEDTAKLKQAYGGKWSWNRRAIWVTINGVTYAASMNGMPHGGSSIKDNNFDGHHCIHFTNSRTHCSDKVCPKHQAAIKKAAQMPLN